MSDLEDSFAGVWVPKGTCIAQIVAVFCVHIWPPGQVLGIRAQLQGTRPLLCSTPRPTSRSRSAHYVVEGDSSVALTRGIQAHFPGVDRTAAISRIAKLGLLSNVTARALSLCTVCSDISGGYCY